MLVFWERFGLTALVAALGALLYTNPMGLDKTNRFLGVIVVVLTAIIVGRYIESQKNQPPKSVEPSEKQPQSTETKSASPPKTSPSDNPVDQPVLVTVKIAGDTGNKFWIFYRRVSMDGMSDKYERQFPSFAPSTTTLKKDNYDFWAADAVTSPKFVTGHIRARVEGLETTVLLPAAKPVSVPVSQPELGIVGRNGSHPASDEIEAYTAEYPSTSDTGRVTLYVVNTGDADLTRGKLIIEYESDYEVTCDQTFHARSYHPEVMKSGISVDIPDPMRPGPKFQFVLTIKGKGGRFERMKLYGRLEADQFPAGIGMGTIPVSNGQIR
jgi:hypothetical protein